MPISLERIDHIHVYVSDRDAAETWYRDVLGLHRDQKLELWSKSDGGPLMLKNTSGTIMLALFKKPFQTCRSTIAFVVLEKEFLLWQLHLNRMLGAEVKMSDHTLSWSMYFHDLDDNPYEITCYDYDELSGKLGIKASKNT